MKPHQLRIEAFGPFATAVEVDFDSLSQEGLFLIHGRTGAGKTFLLDALCFALYGEVSGDRNVRGLKSDHATPAAMPRVSLSFSSGGRRYRVTRSPAWSAPRSRGEGTTDKPAQAVLERLLDHGPEPIASRSSEVTREVEDLVGLNADQFRQVILLPQGRFAEVLRARAEEREALLKTLFNTVLFEQAGRWLEERAKAERLQLLDQERGLAVLRQQALQEWQALQEQDMQEQAMQDGASTDAPPQDQRSLDQLRQRLESLLDVCSRTLQDTEVHWLATQKSKAAQDDLAARWDRRAEAQARLEERLARGEVVDEYRQRLRRAEQAEALRGSLAAEQQASEQLEAIQGATLEQLRHTSQARDAVQGLPASLLVLDLSALPEPVLLAQAGNDLAARRVEMHALLRKQAEASGCRTEAQRAAQSARQALGRLQAAETAIKVHEAERLTALEALQQARSARDRIGGLELAAQQAQRTADAADAIGPAEAGLAACLADQKRWELEISQANASLRQLQRQQIDGMALRLAAALSPGSPCPVCGSPEHPSPARGGSQELVDAELQVAERRLQEAQTRSRSTLSAAAAAESRLQALREQVGTASPTPGGARQQADTAMAALLAAREAALRVPSLETAIQDHDTRLAELQTQRQAAGSEQAVQSATEARETLQATSLEQEIVTALGEGVAPQAVLDGIGRLDPLIKALQRSDETQSRCRSQLEQASGRLARELQASPFADPAAAREALQEEHTRERWSTRIQAYERELLELRGQLASPDL
ncbi:MAG: SMC family ATPase, partial [Synechococcus sp. ELA057]